MKRVVSFKPGIVKTNHSNDCLKYETKLKIDQVSVSMGEKPPTYKVRITCSLTSFCTTSYIHHAFKKP